MRAFKLLILFSNVSKITLALFCSDGINRNDMTICWFVGMKKSEKKKKSSLHSNNEIRCSLILCLLYNSKPAIWIVEYGFIVIRQSECYCKRRSLFANKDIENHHSVENLNAFAIFRTVDGNVKSPSWSCHSWQFESSFFFSKIRISDYEHDSQLPAQDWVDRKKISFVERELNLITSVIFIIFMYVCNK